ncbi:MAG: DNA polymerase [Candidatus Doudnabacteria bacterium]
MACTKPWKNKAKKIKAGTLQKLIDGKAKAYLSYKLAFIDQKGELNFDFEKTKLGDYDQTKVVRLLNSLGIKALNARLPKVSKGSQAELVAAPVIPGKPNAVIKTAEEALIAAYLCNPGQRSYEVGDWADLATELKEKNVLKIFQDIEVPLISVLKNMQKRGIKIDLVWLSDLSKQLDKRIKQLEKEIHKHAGGEFNISSPKQLQEVLFETLQIPTENIKKNKKSGGMSTAANELEKMRKLHPIIELIFEYRELTKLKSTYVDALPLLVSKADGRIHTTYSQTIAATGRLSSINPNLQNIPIRTDLGNEVRKAFIAEKGKVLLSLDYSQIELRIAASLSEDPEMIKIFKSGGDFHTATAARIFNVPEDKVTPNQRRDAKTINFSVLYGVSAFGLSSRSDMSRAEAGEHIKQYFEVFKKLKKYIDGTIEKTRKQGFITNSLGRIRYLPEINASNFAVRGAAERQAFNMPLQSLAADIIKMAMIEIDKKHPDAQMLLSVHDELVFETEKNKAEQQAKYIKNIMENVYKLKVPIEVHAKSGDNWSEMEKIKI